jgi:ABC-type phosphate transport system substrate-binding protein
MLCVLLSTSTSHAQNMVVIVGANSPVKQLSLAQLKRIFLGKERLTEQGQRWIPVNLGATHPLRQVIRRQVLQKSTFNLEQYWNQQYFHGISPPYVLASEEAVLRFVASTPNAIAYIAACHRDKRVKVVYRFKIRPAIANVCR